MEEQSLKDKTVKGVGWSAADAFLGQGVTFIVGLVLARLLSPEEYGLIGICLIFVTILNGIVDSGFSNALIRKKEVSDDDYNTMFLTNMVISIAVYVVLYLTAPLISSFFSRQELLNLLRVMGLIVILQALSITQVTILTKRIDFKTKTKASLMSSITSGAIGICMAYRGFGVWSLVGQQLSNKFLYTITLWLFNKWIPRLSVNWSCFKYMWGFGWKLMVSGLLNNIWNQMYQIVVGKFYSPATLGQYTQAQSYAELLSANITTVVQRVSFPVLAEVQDEKARMVLAYRRIIKTTMFVTVVSLFFLGAISEPLIYTLIGEKWHEAAMFLPYICVAMSLFPLHAINLNMLQVQGRSDLFLILEIIKKAIMILPIILGIFINIYLMLIGSIIIGIVCFFLNSYYTGKDLGYTSFDQIKDVSPSYMIALLVSLSVYFLKYVNLENWIILVIQLFIGIFVLVCLCEAFKLEEYIELKNIFKNFIMKNGESSNN